MMTDVEKNALMQVSGFHVVDSAAHNKHVLPAKQLVQVCMLIFPLNLCLGVYLEAAISFSVFFRGFQCSNFFLELGLPYNMVHVKCDFVGQHLRRFSLRDPVPNSPLRFADLLQILEQTYPTLDLANRNINVTFIDDEGDHCTIEHDADLAEALRVTPNLLRIRVSETFVMPSATDSHTLAGRAIETVSRSFANTAANGGKIGRDLFDIQDVIADYSVHASSDEFANSVSDVMRNPPIFAHKVSPRAVAKSLKLSFRQFVTKNGVVPPRDRNAPLTFASSAIESFLVNIGTALVSHGVTADQILLILRFFEAALNDPGIQTNMVSTIPALKRQEKKLEKQRETPRGPGPLQYLIKAAKTTEAHAAISKFKNALATNPDDKPKLFLARNDLKVLTVHFVADHLQDPEIAPGEDILSQYARDVSLVLSRNGVIEEIRNAASEVANAMARDCDVRKAAMRIKGKHVPAQAAASSAVNKLVPE